MPVTAGLVIGGGSALIRGISGFFQNKKANKLEKENIRPTYQIPDEFNQNLRMAQQMAQVGTPQQQYNNSFNNINRNQSGALNVLSNSANPNGLASVVRAGNDATMNLDAQDANARMNNQGRVFLANNALAGQNLAAQQYNKFDKYTEQYNKAAGLKAAGLQNMNGALSDIGNIGLTYAMSNMDNGGGNVSGGSNGSAKGQNGYIGTVRPGATYNPFNQPQQFGYPQYNSFLGGYNG